MKLCFNFKYLYVFGLSIFQSDLLFSATYQQVLQNAYEQNPEIKQAEIDIKIADEQLSKSHSNLYGPSLDIRVTANENKVFEGPILKKNDATDNWAYGSEVALVQNLYNGGLDQKNYSIQKKQLISAEKKLAIARKKIESQLFQIWIDLFSEYESIKVYQANAEKNKQLYGYIEKQYNNGLISVADYNRHQVDSNNIQIRIINSQKQIEEYKNKIKTISYWKIDNETFQFGSECQLPVENQNKLSKLSLDTKASDIFLTKIQNIFQNENLDLQLKLLEQEISNDISEREISRDLAPNLSLGAYWNYGGARNNTTDTFNHSDPLSIRLALNIPLFKGFTRNNDIAISKYSTTKLTISTEKFKIENEINLDNLYKEIKISFQTFELSRKNFVLQKTLVDNNELRYRQGTLSLKDLLEDQQSLLERELELKRQESTLVKNLFQLEKAINIGIAQI